MIRVSVMYPNDPEKKFDMDYYINKHIPLVHEKLDPIGLVKTEVEKGLTGQGEETDPPYCAIGCLFFNTMDDFQKMLAYNDELMSDIPNFTDIIPAIQISDIIS